MKDRLTAGALLVALVAGLPAAGCFTDPINQPPTIQIADPPQIYHGGNGSLTFTAFDPDHDVLDVMWGAMAGDCPAEHISPRDWRGPRVPAPSGQSLAVGPDVTGGPFCVCTFVTDSHSAGDSDCKTVTPDNHAPELTIGVVAPTVVAVDPSQLVYPLYSKFQLLARATDPDGDPVTFDLWSLTHEPGAATGSLASCGEAADAADAADATRSDRCFTADQPGTYTASVTVFDAFGGTVTTSKTLTIANDRRPCLRESDPELTMSTLAPKTLVPKNPAQDVPFVIKSVDDDGDTSFVGVNRIHFTWYEGPDGGPLINQNNDSSVFTEFADPRRLGQTRLVRVEIHDRNVADIDGILAHCGDAPGCEDPDHVGCLLRTTWKIQYTQ